MPEPDLRLLSLSETGSGLGLQHPQEASIESRVRDGYALLNVLAGHEGLSKPRVA
jgi:hypothetical protein